MKLKILQDIPGFKSEFSGVTQVYTAYKKLCDGNYCYDPHQLIKDGYAEEVVTLEVSKGHLCKFKDGKCDRDENVTEQDIPNGINDNVLKWKSIFNSEEVKEDSQCAYCKHKKHGDVACREYVKSIADNIIADNTQKQQLPSERILEIQKEIYRFPHKDNYIYSVVAYLDEQHKKGLLDNN